MAGGPGLAVASASARGDCIDDAARHHTVNAHVLRAIGWHESRLQPGARGRNRNGTADLGAFQINTAHLPELSRHGVTAATLHDGCASAFVAAWHYARQVRRFGNTWAAVGAYHSRTPARSAWYANAIAAVLARWGVVPAGAPPYPRHLAVAPWEVAARPGSAGPAPPPADAPAFLRSDSPAPDRPLFDDGDPPAP